MKIEDDFLEQEKFDKLQTIIMGKRFDWHYHGGIDYEGESGKKFQFIHMFYSNMMSTSSFTEQMDSILEIINPISIFRIKANLLTRTPNIVENEFHIDSTDLSEEKLKQWTTSIFYINSNNGYTEFQDGRIAMENTIVKSVANRMVTFPANMKHTGTSCTDEKIRIVINFNYYTK